MGQWLNNSPCKPAFGFAKNLHKRQVSVAPWLQFLPGKVSTFLRAGWLGSHISELCVWLRDPASLNRADRLWRMVSDIKFEPPYSYVPSSMKTHIHMCVYTPCTCARTHMEKEKKSQQHKSRGIRSMRSISCYSWGDRNNIKRELHGDASERRVRIKGPTCTPAVNREILGKPSLLCSERVTHLSKASLSVRDVRACAFLFTVFESMSYPCLIQYFPWRWQFGGWRGSVTSLDLSKAVSVSLLSLGHVGARQSTSS